MKWFSKKNKRPLWYANFVEKRPVREYDEWGNLSETGEWEIIYTEPKKLAANISAAKGTSEVDVFGNSLDYDRVVGPLPSNTPIDELSIIWIDHTPVFDTQVASPYLAMIEGSDYLAMIEGSDYLAAITTESGGSNNVPHDYVIKRVADSKNIVMLAVSKVNVTTEARRRLQPFLAMIEGSDYLAMIEGSDYLAMLS